MRLTFTFILACLLTMKIGSAQTDEGSILVGGDLSFNSSSSETAGEETQSTSAFSINPQAGYFISDGFALGLGIGYETSTVTNNSGQQEIETTTNTFRVSPFGRYYKEIGDNISLFGQAEFGFASESQSESDVSTTIIDFNAQPGLAIFASDKVGINFFLPGVISFSNETSENANTDDDVDSNFGINFNTRSVGLGVNFFL